MQPVPTSPQNIAHAAKIIQNGGLVAFPTETVYGLGANALDERAVQRIFTAKSRPSADPLIIHLAQPAQFEQVARDIPPLAWALADAFCPGPLTLVLPRAAHIPLAVTAGRDTVAVRIPAHPVALALLHAANLPIAAPSANRFGHTSPTTAQHVYNDLQDRLDLILDGGATPIGIESTILDLTQTPPALLRPGGLPLETLRAFIEDIQLNPAYLQDDAARAGLPAPGMLLKHYAPRTPLTLFRGPSEHTVPAMLHAAQRYAANRVPVAILALQDDLPHLSALHLPIRTLGPATDLTIAARNLFAALRELDTLNLAHLLARTVPPTGLGLALNDRLYRAAEGRTIDC